jgi:hypothetical protein
MNAGVRRAFWLGRVAGQGTSNIHSHEVLELYREAAFLWQSERIALDLASPRHITDLVIGPEQQRIKAGPMWGGKI